VFEVDVQAPRCCVCVAAPWDMHAGHFAEYARDVAAHAALPGKRLASECQPSSGPDSCARKLAISVTARAT
jgi:hypothetical protein